MPILASYGGTFRDHKANHIGSFACFLGPGNALSELMEEIMAMEHTISNSWENFCLESDSMLVVKAFTTSSLVPWNLTSMNYAWWGGIHSNVSMFLWIFNCLK